LPAGHVTGIPAAGDSGNRGPKPSAGSLGRPSVRVYSAGRRSAGKGKLEINRTKIASNPSEIAAGHRSISVCPLANIARRLGRSLAWDPVVERFADDEANRLVSPPRRQGYALPTA
jgi:hypothetical protein